MKRLSILGMVIFSLAACSHAKLEKDQAASIIRSAMAYPKVYDYEINTVDHIEARKELDAGLEDGEWVKVDRAHKLEDADQPFIHFTDKAKPYLLRADSQYKDNEIVKVADMDLGKVTGIQMQDDGKKALVEYTVIYKNITPFAKLIHRDLTKPETERASLTLFDTGWKMDKRVRHSYPQ